MSVDFVQITYKRAIGIQALLKELDNDRAKKMIEYLENVKKAAYGFGDSTYYSPSAKLTPSELRNGEIVQILNSLEMFALLYEPKTADVMKAAAELIKRLICEVSIRSYWAKKEEKKKVDARRELKDILDSRDDFYSENY